MTYLSNLVRAVEQAACLKFGVAFLVVMALLAGSSRAAEKRWWETIPDFTKGQTFSHASEKDLENIHGWKHWAMGPTGAYIWVWAEKKTICSDGAKQIYVLKVDLKTPADGKLQAGDVILGAAGGKEAKPFVKNARREVARAIIDAERSDSGGKLILLVWRKGKTFTATLQLRTMGRYSATSPASCNKSKSIIDQAAAAIMKRGLGKGDIPTCFDALGLLATGEESYLPVVREFARQMKAPAPQNRGMVSWSWSHELIFLAEYYLATKDRAVLPTIKKFAVAIAEGCSGAGTWGHGMARPETNGGRLHGVLGGYGAMNSTGIPLTIGLVLAQKCGVQSKDVDMAVKRSASFLRYFAEKGSIPYGDHAPFLRYYCNNGKNSGAAVLFDLLGDSQAASFFTAMTLASVREREQGHTGPYFSMAWGALGAGCGGPAATAAFMKDMRWYYELQRRPGGEFRYQPVLMGGEEHGKYGRKKKWSMSGVALMHYCLPRKAIYLTGKGGRAAGPLTGDEIRSCIEVASKEIYKDRAAQQLLKLLEHRLPVTRVRAAAELARRSDNVAPQLIAMLDSDNPYARYGACDGLRYASGDSTQAADALVSKLLKSDDSTFRYFAARAFAHPSGGRGFRAAARRAVPALMELAVTNDPADPHRKLQATIASVLFYSGNARGYSGIFRKGKGLKTVDRKLLIPAVRSLLTNPNGDARSMVGKIYPELTKQDLKLLWGNIYTATKDSAPSGVMFSVGIQDDGLRMLSKHHFKEGMELAAYHLMRDKHSKIRRIPFFLDILKSYGAAAKPLITKLKAKRLEMTAKWKGMSGAKKKAYMKMLKQRFEEIESSTEAPEVKGMANYLKEAK